MRPAPPSLQYLRRSNLSFREHTFKTSRYAPALGEGGGLGTPYDGLYGEAPPERGIFFRDVFSCILKLQTMSFIYKKR